MRQSAGKFLAIPLALFVVFLSLYAIWLILDLPPEEVLLPIVHRFFERYGVLTALACGLIEALLLVGWYFPGTTIIVAGLILSGADLAQYAAMAGAAAAGLSTGHLINFLVGRHGWYRLLLAFGLKDSLDTAQQWLLKYGLSAIFTTYWQINLASLTSTAAGILRFPLVPFVIFSSSATVLWIGFWSTAIYFLGQAAMTLVGLRLALVVIALWISVRLLLYARANRVAARTALATTEAGALRPGAADHR
jgi:membrane protein DedA with SNARE-associated domain